MKQVIWKKELNNVSWNSENKLTVTLPYGSEIIKIAMQGDIQTPVAWFRCDPNQTHEVERTLLVVGTGHEFELKDAGNYICTVSMYDGRLVLHFFESHP